MGGMCDKNIVSNNEQSLKGDYFERRIWWRDKFGINTQLTELEKDRSWTIRNCGNILLDFLTQDQELTGCQVAATSGDLANMTLPRDGQRYLKV